MRRQGWTITDIAAEVGRHPDTVARSLKVGERWARRIEELLARNRNLLATSPPLGITIG